MLKTGDVKDLYSNTAANEMLLIFIKDEAAKIMQESAGADNLDMALDDFEHNLNVRFN